MNIRRWLPILLLLVICVPALAADGDTTLFESELGGYSTVSPEGVVALNDTLYISTWEELYAYKLGDAEPTLVCKTRDAYDYQQQPEVIPVPVDSIGGVAPTEEANPWPESFCAPFAYQGKLYLVGDSSGKLRVLEEGRLADTALKIERPSTLPDDYGISNALSGAFEDEGKLYALVRIDMDNWDAPQELWLIDPSTGGHSVIKTELPVNGVCPYKPGQLLCWSKPAWGTLGNDYSNDAYTPKLFAIDAATGKIVDGPADMVMADNWNGPAALAYDAARGKILYVTVNKLMAMDAIGAEPELISYFSRQLNSNRSIATILSGTHLVVPSWDGVFLRNISVGPPTMQPLRILNGWVSDSASAFMRDNPDVPLDFFQVDYLSNEDLTQKILGGDASFDILRVWGGDSFGALMEKGFMLDLSRSEKLKAAGARMYPALSAALSVDGKLMALPMSIYPTLWRYNKEKFEEFGLTYPETLPDYIDLLTQWEDGLKDEHPELTLIDGNSQYGETLKSRMLSMATSAYAVEFAVPGAPLKVDTPEFREIMHKVEQMPGEFVEAAPTDGSYEYKPSLLFTDGDLQYWDYESHATTLGWVPGIRRDTDRKMPISFSVYVINPNSPNVDQALRFLEYTAEHGEAADMILMYPDYDVPVAEPWAQESLKGAEEELERLSKIEITEENRRDIEQDIKDAERWRDEYIHRQWRISPETIAQYRVFAEHMVVENDSALYSGKSGEQVMELFSRYTGGQIGLDQLIKELDQKLQMIFLEQQ